MLALLKKHGIGGMVVWYHVTLKPLMIIHSPDEPTMEDSDKTLLTYTCFILCDEDFRVKK